MGIADPDSTPGVEECWCSFDRVPFISFHTLLCNNGHEFGNGRRAKASFYLALSVVKGAVLVFS